MDREVAEVKDVRHMVFNRRPSAVQNVLVDPRLADSIDRRIIDQLRVDGRRSFGEIGRYVGLSEASVRSRYNRLRKLGIVQVVGGRSKAAEALQTTPSGRHAARTTEENHLFPR